MAVTPKLDDSILAHASKGYVSLTRDLTAAVKIPGPLATKPIPARVFYGQAERQSNPNLDAPGDPTGNNGLRNRNDPISCATVTGLAGA